MLWNVKQVANYFGVSISMVYKLVSNNELPCVRLCGCIRFRPETVESLAKEKTNGFMNGAEIKPIMNTDVCFNSQNFYNKMDLI